MKLIYIQPIFCPDDMRFERNLNSLVSMKKLMDTYGHIECIFGGWSKKEVYWNEIERYIKGNFNHQRIFQFDKNYGKAVVVNNLHKQIEDKNIEYDFFLTADSDILFKSDTNIFERLINVSSKLPQVTNKRFGMMSLNQEGLNCHYKTVYENKIEIGGEVIVYPNSPSGIAGGCLFISKPFWKEVGGYKVFGVYSGDDAMLLQQCGQLKYGYYMSDSISIIHPSENDEEYAKWKVRVCQQDFRTGIKSDISNSIKEADLFWENRP